MKIRRAEEKDCERITELLYQVQKVHSDGRPDLFTPGAKKYTETELMEIIQDDLRPVFVAADEADRVLGYAFCIYEEIKDSGNSPDRRMLYIDDLCVDESIRGQHIGFRLYEYVKEEAKANGCYHITLNVWNLNEPAQKFYERVGLKPLKTMMEMIL